MSLNLEKLIPFLVSLFMSALAMACFTFLDQVVTMDQVIVNGESKSFLGCNDLVEQIQIYHDVSLSFSPSRIIKLAKWNKKKLVKHHSLNSLAMEAKFRQDLALFKTVLKDQLIGYCDDPGHLAFITHFHGHHHNHHQPHPESLQDRLMLCSSYAEILAVLHDHDLELNFDDLQDFLAWSVIVTQQPHWRLILDDVQLMEPHTNASIDIWMAPEVCNAYLLSKDRQAKIYLTDIHKKCRHKDPDKRPTAQQLVKAYKEVIFKFSKELQQ